MVFLDVDEVSFGALLLWLSSGDYPSDEVNIMRLSTHAAFWEIGELVEQLKIIRISQERFLHYYNTRTESLPLGLSRTDLRGLSLIGLTLTNCSLASCNLSGVEFTGTRLSGANLSNALLSGANLTRAILERKAADLQDDVAYVELISNIFFFRFNK
jgi:hypothetical protein